MPLDLFRTTEKKTGTKDEDHEFVGLVLREFSLVSDAAILRQSESDAGVGVVVVKFADNQTIVVPESVAKAIAPQGDEDLRETLGRLVDVCRNAVMIKTGDRNDYWMSALKIRADHVLMGEPWDDPFTGKFTAYKCDFTQDGEGNFSIPSVTPQVLQFVEAGTTSKNLQQGDEAMKVLKGVELGGQVLEMTLAAGSEFKVGSDVVVKTNDKGEPSPGPGYTLGDDGIARKSAPPPVVAAPAAKGTDAAALAEALAKTGKAFTMKVAADGSVTVESGAPEAPATVVPPPAPATPAAVSNDEAIKNLEAANKANEVEIQRLKQKAAGTSASDRDAANADTTKSVEGPKAAVEKAVAPFANSANGFWTSGFTTGTIPASFAHTSTRPAQ